MIEARGIERAIRRVKDQASFVNELLVGALGWPIDEPVEELEDVTFEWSARELRAEGLDQKVVDGVVRQIRPFRGNPWGIFILEFKSPEVFAADRGMTSTLRKVLRGLVPRRRAIRDPRLAAFSRENLLFICSNSYKHYRFAYFKSPTDASEGATLATFGWGPGDPIRTACEYNLSSLGWPEDDEIDQVEWLRLWSAAFDVEKVTKRFYEDYKSVFDRVEQAIARHTGVRGEQLRLVTQTLFNRLMFLRFVERKGWLAFPGQQGTNYLAALISAGSGHRGSLYTSCLQPLFFEGLSVPGKQTAGSYGAVPLLNGGLFDRTDRDDDVQDIPDEALQAIIGPDGLFYRYNFTVEESTPLDIEVAVDPEMLGKVFEELVTGRHESGSYYTPRPVVSFMCREALKGYLSDNTSAPYGAIKRLVDERVVDGLNETHAQQIENALDDVKAVDPACGSGAYLLGLLQELIAVRRCLRSERILADAQFLFALKLHIISNTLYGVDIDPFATEIAKLRLWLSLAVEAEKPIGLPNLDFKIEVGDSLLSPNPMDIPDLFRDRLQRQAETLLVLKEEFLTARGRDKERARARIQAGEKEIAKALNAPALSQGIDWRIRFVEVFVKHGGFDIALANPPYISAIEFRRTHCEADRAALNRLFLSARGAYDLYVLFFERAVQLLKSGGTLSFITPNKYLSASYASALREYLRGCCQFLVLVDLSGIPVFEQAVYPVLSFFKRETERGYTIRALLPDNRSLDAFDLTRYREVNVADKMLDLLPDRIWGFLLSDRLDLLQQVLVDTVPLEQLGDVSATTTAAEADEYGALLRNKGGVRDFKVVNTGTIDRFRSLWGRRDLTHSGSRYATPYLARTAVSERRSRIYSSPKLLFAKLARECEAMLDAKGEYASLNTNCFFAPQKGLTLEYVCAFCNSPVFAFLYEQFFGGLRMSGGYLQFQAPQLRVIPMRLPEQKTLQEVTRLVRDVARRLEREGLEPSAYSHEVRDQMYEINVLVCSVYGIDVSELIRPRAWPRAFETGEAASAEGEGGLRKVAEPKKHPYQPDDPE